MPLSRKQKIDSSITNPRRPLKRELIR